MVKYRFRSNQVWVERKHKEIIKSQVEQVKTLTN